MRRVLPAILVLSVLLPVPARAGAGAPNYFDTSGLSAPVYAVTSEDVRITMRDGVRIYAHIVRPVDAPPAPVIVELSPYNGAAGNRAGSAMPGLVSYFAPRGYAVALVDLRGTSESEGCMDYLGPTDRADAYEIVEWLGTRPWSNGRVGLTGVSYIGSTPVLAAAARPPHLATIVPIAGLAQMYDHEFQAGVPYFLQWAGPVAAYESEFAAVPPLDATDPGWPQNVAAAGCGTFNGAAATGADWLTGRYTPWHAARDFRAAAAAADIPVFLVQGVPDRSVRAVAAEWFLRRRDPRDKLWLGRWGHTATDRGRQWKGILHRWFDRQLLERDVDTGPPVEVFLNGTGPGARGPVRTASSWPGTDGSLTLYPSAGGTLDTTPPAAGNVVYVASPAGYQTGPLGQLASFDSAPAAADVEIAGFADTVLDVTLPDGRRIDVLATLYDVDPAKPLSPGRITQAAINPELREGLDRVEPVVAGERMRLRPPAQPTDWLLRAGHRLRLVVSSAEDDKVPVFAGPGVVVLHAGGPDAPRITLGTVSAPTLFTDPGLF